MKVSVVTLGCKTNQAESSLIEGDLLNKGCEIVDLDGAPEFCIINTCSVTSKSDYQSRQLIRRAYRTGAKIIVTGCYSELNYDFVKSMDGVSVAIKNKNKVNSIKVLFDISKDNTLNYNKDNEGRSRFFMKVQDGCNYSCSYCIIPAARGRSTSIDIDEIVNQINAIVGTFNEVVLTGIHLGTYGYDLKPKVKLSTLIKRILCGTSIRRIRLSSLECREVDDDLLDLLPESRICKHLHIPLQSGDNSILKLMNRKYSLEEIRGCIEKIVQKIPDIAIGTDVIVGFPGEGQSEFNNTYNTIQAMPFSYIHVFPFSPRSGTPAHRMPKNISEDIKKQRCAILRQLGLNKKRAYMLNQIGRNLDILVEDISADKLCAGITGNYLKAEAVRCHAKPRDIVSVRIANVKDNILIAEPIEVR